MRLWTCASSACADSGTRMPDRRLSHSEQAWWLVMGYEAGPPCSLSQVEQRFRRLAPLAHPDRGGSAEQMQRLIRARSQARRQLTP